MQLEQVAVCSHSPCPDHATCVSVTCSFQRLVFTTAAKLFSSTYRIMVEGDGEAVGYMNPLLAMAATVNVSSPGQQPDLRAATEDMRLLDSSLTDKSGEQLCQHGNGFIT